MYTATIRTIGLSAALLFVSSLVRAEDAGNRPPNTLTAQEQKDGWKLLFDGKTTAGWRAFRGKEIPGVWSVVDGALVVAPKSGTRGGDLVTDGEYGNFEFAFDWKVSPGANSGVMYRVSEEFNEPWMTGPEYQVLDNDKHRDGRNPKTAAASCYALYAPSAKKTKPVGEWNEGRIVVNGNHVEHWLNGEKVVEYDFGSSDWNDRVAKSKFKALPKFGKEPTGHIDLQFHGDQVAFRNLRIRVRDEHK
jgi:hypothetical protein